MSHVRAQVEQHCRDFLLMRDEDAMWLSGPRGAEWHAAYQRCLEYVCHKMHRELGWRDFILRREAVVSYVKQALERK
ncbi:MAG: hypothetical protein E6Q97_32095 [Desulfurellales bacterium]|nr:MAG: hypothetical protein E6Q97_32095 [Desulfurellales bacterium]